MIKKKRINLKYVKCRYNKFYKGIVSDISQLKNAATKPLKSLVHIGVPQQVVQPSELHLGLLSGIEINAALHPAPSY